MTRPLNPAHPSLPVEDIPTEPVEVLDGDQLTGLFVKFELQPDGFIMARDVPPPSKEDG